MNLFDPKEIIQRYAAAGKTKIERAPGRMFLLAVLAGLLIALSGATASTATHSIGNVSVVRLVSGLLFPFGLAMVMLLGAELFTGNCMLPVSVLEKHTSFGRMLRSWGIVYVGNFAGALLLAAGCAFFGQFDYSAGGLAVYTIKLAAGKCALSFPSALVLGFFCNLLVCAGVLCALSAKDAAGRILGAYLPVAFFVICGFEHCVANMYYIPAGLFALRIPAYAQLAAAAGVDTALLTWGNFFLHNLLPVTIGNLLGGLAIGLTLWFVHLKDVGGNP